MKWVLRILCEDLKPTLQCVWGRYYVFMMGGSVDAFVNVMLCLLIVVNVM